MPVQGNLGQLSFFSSRNQSLTKLFRVEEVGAVDDSFIHYK